MAEDSPDAPKAAGPRAGKIAAAKATAVRAALAMKMAAAKLAAKSKKPPDSPDDSDETRAATAQHAPQQSPAPGIQAPVNFREKPGLCGKVARTLCVCSILLCAVLLGAAVLYFVIPGLLKEIDVGGKRSPIPAITPDEETPSTKGAKNASIEQSTAASVGAIQEIPKTTSQPGDQVTNPITAIEKDVTMATRVLDNNSTKDGSSSADTIMMAMTTNADTTVKGENTVSVTAAAVMTSDINTATAVKEETMTTLPIADPNITTMTTDNTRTKDGNTASNKFVVPVNRGRGAPFNAAEALFTEVSRIQETPKTTEQPGDRLTGPMTVIKEDVTTTSPVLDNNATIDGRVSTNIIMTAMTPNADTTVNGETIVSGPTAAVGTNDTNTATAIKETITTPPIPDTNVTTMATDTRTSTRDGNTASNTTVTSVDRGRGVPFNVAGASFTEAQRVFTETVLTEDVSVLRASYVPSADILL